MNFTSPQIVQYLKNMSDGLNMPQVLVVEDIKQPTADKLINAMKLILDIVMGSAANSQDFRQAPLNALNKLTYPELYDSGANELQTYQNILEFCWEIGVHHISFKHLFFPDPANTLEMLKSAVNFCIFHGNQMQLYEELVANEMEMAELLQAAKEEQQNLEPEVQKLKQEFDKCAPVLAAAEAEVVGLQAAVDNSMKDVQLAKDETKKLKAEILKEEGQMASDQFSIATLKQEIEKLRSQIVQSPDKLLGRLSEAERAVEIKRREVEEENAKLRQMQEKHLAVNKVLNKLAKRVACAKDCEQEKKKAKELHKELRQINQDSLKEEEKINELKATANHLDTQLSKSQDKLVTLQKQGEQKRVKAQQALDDTERQKRELAYSIQQDKEQVKGNQSIIQRKEQEMQFLISSHAFEMQTLKKHYIEFAKNLRVWHSEMLHATCEHERNG